MFFGVLGIKTEIPANEVDSRIISELSAIKKEIETRLIAKKVTPKMDGTLIQLYAEAANLTTPEQLEEHAAYFNGSIQNTIPQRFIKDGGLLGSKFSNIPTDLEDFKSIITQTLKHSEGGLVLSGISFEEAL